MPTHNQITSRKQKRHVVHPDQDISKPQSRLESGTQAKASSSAPSTAATTDTHDINVGLSKPKTSSMPKEKVDFTKFEEMENVMVILGIGIGIRDISAIFSESP